VLFVAAICFSGGLFMELISSIDQMRSFFTLGFGAICTVISLGLLSQSSATLREYLAIAIMIVGLGFVFFAISPETIITSAQWLGFR
jgi:hypothetical protein